MNMMGGMMDCGGWMTLGWLLGIALLLLAVVGIIWITRHLLAGRARGTDERSQALEQLDLRYARGDIDRETYIAMRDDLQPRSGRSA